MSLRFITYGSDTHSRIWYQKQFSCIKNLMQGSDSFFQNTVVQFVPHVRLLATVYGSYRLMTFRRHFDQVAGNHCATWQTVQKLLHNVNLPTLTTVMTHN